MIGPRFSTVFKSRWNALLWSGGILLLAYCSVPEHGEPEKASPQPKAEHVNPWGKPPE